ncbi:GGDEF domain-containing protein [Caproiciproducens sp. NJN-50]|uniref:GGDEF domain-containing protein n=1 Tax=Acutalibacteraceae TaxID=3082771 RepID=UPI000FFE07B4|nr:MULTISPECIES: GGDEF domain-containing protein [Acutalibacteraceae]QAT48503.1 GGDEF domain-containing protein [Caproiciproducens sp. NJN-50]
MTEKMTLNKLRENLDFFNKMYDAVRLVDPIRKRVMECRGNSTGETCEVCYDYWGNGRICENCVSVRAHREQKSFMKLEHSPGAVMLLTALPVESAEPPVVLELLKNATDTMLIGSGEYNKGEKFFDAVRDINNMAIRDELTSLYNRRFLDDRLPVDIVSAVAEQKPLSVIFADIDNMKTVNDTYGHAAGDKLLRRAADTIRTCIRTGADWAARYGGDEFVICLKNTGGDGARRISERIYRDLEKTMMSIGDCDITVMVSLGVVTMPASGLTAKELVEMADREMYRTKEQHKKSSS